MSQPNRLMDLLVDEDDDGDTSAEEAQELEALLRSRTPTPGHTPSAVPAPMPGMNPQAANQQGGQVNFQANQAGQGPSAGTSMHDGNQRPAAQPGQQRAQTKFPFHLLQNWFTKNYPQDQAQALSAALESVKVKHQNTRMDQGAKEIYKDVGKAIGGDKLQEFCAYFGKTMQAQRQAMGKGPPKAGPTQQQQPAMQQAQVAQNRSHQFAQQQVRPQAQGNPGQNTAAPQNMNPLTRPPQAWMANGAQYTQPGSQNAQPGAGVSFPAFTPVPTSTAQGNPGMAAMMQGRSHVPMGQGVTLQQAQRSHLLHQAPGTARPIAYANPPAPQKHPADSSLPGQPASKKAKKDKEDIDEENDIFKDTGVDLEAEANALLGNMERAPTPQARPQPQAVETPFLNLNPLQIKIEEIARRNGLSSVDPKVGLLLSRALDTHLSSIMNQVFAMSRQRIDADRRRPGMVMSNNTRKRLHEMNMKEEEARKQKESLKQQDTENAPQVGSKRKREEDAAAKMDDKATKKISATAANAAAKAAFGSSKQKWNKWGQTPKTGDKPPESGAKPQKPETAKPPTPAILGDSASRKPPVANPTRPDPENVKNVSRAGAEGLAASRVNAEMLTARLPDLVAVMEKDRWYQKSTLLYKLLGQLRD